MVLWFTAILIGLISVVAAWMRLKMWQIFAMLFKGQPFPELTKFVLTTGPYTPFGIFLVAVLTIIVIIGLGWVLKGSAREAYFLYAPAICALFALLYFMLMSLGFFLPFVNIAGNLTQKAPSHQEASWF